MTRPPEQHTQLCADGWEDEIHGNTPKRPQFKPKCCAFKQRQASGHAIAQPQLPAPTPISQSLRLQPQPRFLVLAAHSLKFRSNQVQICQQPASWQLERTLSWSHTGCQPVSQSARPASVCTCCLSARLGLWAGPNQQAVCAMCAQNTAVSNCTKFNYS